MLISGQVRNSSLFKDIKQSPIAGGKAISIAMRQGSRDQRQSKSRQMIDHAKKGESPPEPKVMRRFNSRPESLLNE